MPLSTMPAGAERRRLALPLVRDLAKTTNLTPMEISKQIGLPYETVRRWCKRIKRPASAVTRLPKGAAVGFENLNVKLLYHGVAPLERLRILEEARRAA